MCITHRMRYGSPLEVGLVMYKVLPFGAVRALSVTFLGRVMTMNLVIAHW